MEGGEERNVREPRWLTLMGTVEKNYEAEVGSRCLVFLVRHTLS